MPNHYLLKDYKKLIEYLTPIIEDKKLEFDGYKDTLPFNERGSVQYYFALDAHEIGKYCFPIDINKSNYSQEELDNIIDSQIAYFDIFFKYFDKPIIFKEYEEELNGTFEYFKSFSNTVREGSKQLLLTEFYENVKNTYQSFEDDSKYNDFAVAFKLALLSVGVDRLTKIYPDRINFESKQERSDLTTLLLPLENYKTNNTDLEYISKIVRAKHDVSNERSLKRDIISIDKINFLNNYFIANGKNLRILYFSSALRTQFILNEIINYKNKLNSCKFYPWRTPIQIYLYLIFRELDENNKNIKTKETIGILEEFKAKISDIVNIENKIHKNYFEPAAKSAEIEEMLQKRKTNYMQRLDNIESSQLENINDLFGLADKKIEQNINKNLEKYFREKEESSAIRNLFNTINKPSKEETDIDNLLIQLQTDIKLSDIIPIEVSDNNDIITNCYDTYPFLLYIDNSEYQRILDDLLYEYWIDYYKQVQNKQPSSYDKYKIINILEDFLALEKEMTVRSQDHYTVSVMLHLVNSNKNSDIIAKEYVEKLEKLGKVDNNVNLQYIKASISRRTREYSESINLCDKYRNEDFRFGYCRALAVIGLVTEKKENLIDNDEKELIDTAINDLTNTFEILGKTDIKDKQNFQAAICSDIVYLASLYFHCSTEEKQLHFPSKPLHNEKAENYLIKLKNLKPKEEWYPLFPDFYHSEAFHEYTTIKAYIEVQPHDEEKNYCILPTSGDWQKRLNSALEDISQAIKCSVIEEKKNLYEDLKKKLNKLRDKL